MDINSLSKARMLTPADGYPPQLGMLIALLEHSRLRTMQKVANLSVRQLDHVQDENANSIGTLLLHIAAVEMATLKLTFYGQSFLKDPSQLGKWEMPLFMGDRARQEIKGNPVEYYFDELRVVREETLNHFDTVDDAWLWTPTIWKRGISTNYYWLWFHVMEDETGHRGEISWLMSRIPQ